MRHKRVLAGTAVVAAFLGAAMTGTAHADTNTTSTTAVAVVGSDTTMNAMEGLSNLPSLNSVLANYLATPVGRTITPLLNPPGTAPAGSDCAITVPRNSGEGRDALSASMRNASFNGGFPNTKTSAQFGGCVVVARSSSGSNPTTSPGVGTMTYIPFATDAVDLAVPKTNTLGKSYSLTVIKDIYTRNGAAGTAACLNATPLLPAEGSGTRSFWASALGITDWDFSGTGDTGTVGTPPATGVVTWGSCVTGGAANSTGVGAGAGNGNPGDRIGGASGTPVQEHNGTVLTSGTGQMVPFSVGQYISQGGGVITDIRGSAVLSSIDFTSTTDGSTTANLVEPWGLNGAGATTSAAGFSGPIGNLTRPVYNVLPTTLIDPTFTAPAGSAQIQFKTASATLQTAFVGASSTICSATSTIQLYGFATTTSCGSITKRNTN